MLQSRKFIIFTVMATILLAGSIGGIAFAQTENVDDSQPKAQCGALLDRACEIYQQNTGTTIDQEALKAAFAQAAGEMRGKALENRPEMSLEAIQNRLQKLVDEGKITQEQANEYLERWQSRPDVPVGFGFPGHGGFRGMGGPPCIPAE